MDSKNYFLILAFFVLNGLGFIQTNLAYPQTNFTYPWAYYHADPQKYLSPDTYIVRFILRTSK